MALWSSYIPDREVVVGIVVGKVGGVEDTILA